jgi:hypothetical protein
MGPRGDVVRFLGMCQLRDGVWASGPVCEDAILASSIDRRVVDHPVWSWGLCAVFIVREPRL